MKATHQKPQRQSKLPLALIILLVSCLHSSAQIRPTAYQTPSYIDFELAELVVHEGSTNLCLTVWRTGEYRETATIEFKTAEDTASEGEDYRGSGGTLNFKPGESYKTISVTILADDRLENAESFRVELSSASPNCTLLRDTATITIAESNSQAPILSIVPAPNGMISISWSASADFILERSQSPAGPAWESIPDQPTRSGSTSHLLQPASGPFYFYRLRSN